MSVMLRVITTGAPRAATVKTMLALERMRMGWDIDLHECRGPDTTSFNMCWRDARKAEPDFFIMMMDDIGIRADLLAGLVGHDVPVVDCAVPQVKSGHVVWYIMQMTADMQWYTDSPYPQRGIIPAYSSALACCCYRHDVLMNEGGLLPEPFWRERLDEGGCYAQPLSTADTMACKSFHEAEIPFYVDTDAVADHFGKMNAREMVDKMRWYSKSFMKEDPGEDWYGLPSRSHHDCRDNDTPVSKWYRDNAPEEKPSVRKALDLIMSVKAGEVNNELISRHGEEMPR